MLDAHSLTHGLAPNVKIELSEHPAGKIQPLLKHINCFQLWDDFQTLLLKYCPAQTSAQVSSKTNSKIILEPLYIEQKFKRLNWLALNFSLNSQPFT